MQNSNKLSYYRDCYKEDSADLNLWNLTKRPVADQFFLSDQDDIGSGEFQRFPIDTDFAQHIIKQLEMYKREKTLLYTSFVLVGKFELQGRTTQIISPLVFNEADVSQDQEHYYFSLNQEHHDVNDALLQLLFPEGNSQSLPSTQRSILASSQWVSYLQKSETAIQALDLLKFPALMGNVEIQAALKRETPSLLPISMLVLVERSASSRGVLHEIDQLTTFDNLSAPLSELFNEKPKAQQLKPISPRYDYLPGLLSKAQKEVLTNATNQTLSCVSGPPGTGKSYTIAATAAEHMARGESVLIVANNEAALDVIAEKLDQNFAIADISIRAGKKQFLKNLKGYLEDLLAGYGLPKSDITAKDAQTSLQEINNTLSKNEHRFVRFCQKAIKRGQRLHKFQNKKSKLLLNLYLLLSSARIKQLIRQWQVLAEINQQQLSREQMAARYLNAVKSENLSALLATKRASLQAFNKAIRSRSSKRQFDYFNDIEYSSLLAAFPIWLVSLNSLYRVLPLEREMFDLVIIDEATQSNISSCLPAFYRAKRALVVGDTKQLRHYSFLARDKQHQLAQKHQLNPEMDGVTSYRDDSILDLSLARLTRSDLVVLLDEHFRSRPELIHFSNQHFYRNQLKVMQHRPCTSSGFLHLSRINGQRDNKGVNDQEAQAVIQRIKASIERYELHSIPITIGAVSPFRHQAQHIAQLILDNFSPEAIAKHKLLAATPYGFQGEERDIMLISFAIDNESKRAASYLNKPDVFNVCITRAKQQQWIMLSIDEQQLTADNLLRKYVDSITAFKAQHTIASQIDEFQTALSQSLNPLGIETWPGFQAAGTEVDLLCRKNGVYLAIDLIGYPGPWEDFFELDTYKLLQRAGIEILPISYGLWIVDKQACIDQILCVFDRSKNNQLNI
jgi:hypothetical protein